MTSNDITLTLIYEGLQGLRNDVIELKADVAELKADVTQLQADVAELKSDVTQLKADVIELKADVKQLDSRVTKLEQTTQQLQEIVILNQKNSDARFSDMLVFMGIGFAIVAIVVSFTSILAPSILEYFKQKLTTLSRENLRAIVNETINSQLHSQAVNHS